MRALFRACNEIEEYAAIGLETHCPRYLFLVDSSHDRYSEVTWKKVIFEGLSSTMLNEAIC